MRLLPPTPPLALSLLSRVADAWLQGDPTVRGQLVADLATSTGLDPASVERLVTLWAQTASPDALAAFQRACPTGWRPAGTVAIVAPGNMPVATWQLLSWAWLSGDRVRLRPSRGDPFAARNLWRSLVEVATRIGVALDPTAWLVEVSGDHADPAIAEALLAGADSLLVMGGDAAAAAWSARAAALRFGGPIRAHDARHAAAVLGPDTPLDVAAPLLAHDILLADGRGCLSLRTILAVGHDPDALHAALDRALTAGRLAFPAGRLAPQLLAERQLLADEAALRAAMGEPLRVRRWDDALLLTSPATPGETRVGFGSRAVLVLVLPSWQEALAWLDNQPRLTALAVADPLAVPEQIAGFLRRRLQAGRQVSIAQHGRLQAPALARWPDGIAPWEALLVAP